ncbi:hypothetical protein QUF74_03855 [Candidatus Halobeggiatoa sp. HSG11]|nr:hypothetical protein [Candidatus Halobeggiatoa sp. HSG11]
MEPDKSITIRRIERLVYQQNTDEAIIAIIRILELSESRGGIKLDNESSNKEKNDRQLEQVFLNGYTRLASVFTAFFSNPKILLSPEGFQAIVKNKKHLLGIFELSGFGSAEHMLGLVGTQTTSDKFSIQNEQQLMKFLIFYSLGSEIEIGFAELIKKSPKLLLPIYINLIGEEGVLDFSAAKNRDNLLRLGPLLEDIPLENFSNLTSLSVLWMYCSYTSCENKHDIKHHLNIIIQKFMKQEGVTTPFLPVPRKIKQRPVMLIVSERFTSKHAMYRCYAPSIQQLQEKFELVCITEKRFIDDNSKQLFDKVIYVDKEKTAIKKLVGKVIKLKPDIIYFPSLGMLQWTLLLANLRLAPIQFMTLGHPATSKSPFVDYIFMTNITFSDKVDCYSEKVVLLDDEEALVNIPPINFVKCPPDISKNPPILKLIVTSTSLKLNVSFIAVCKEILDNSQKTIEFHFFPAERGMSYQKIKQRIRNWIPNAEVYPFTDYNTYIGNLNKCDIHLSPFPFGGSNSNIDSMRQGLPIVAMEGHEAHSRIDSIFLKLGKLPSWLITYSKEEYVKAALRLIHNDEERVAISEALLNLDFDNVFMDHEFRNHEKVFGKAVEWLYQNHDFIQDDGRKVWTVEAQQELSK